MARVEATSSTILSTGNKLLILPNNSTLDIEYVTLSVIDSASAYSHGSSDATVTYSYNETYDESSATTFIHYKNIGGVKTKVIEFTVTSFDIGEFWINVTTLNQQTQIIAAAYGN